MKKQFLHDLSDSFRLWIENKIINDGSGYRNVSGSLYRINSNNFPNNSVYSNPYGQMVYDSSVSGAYIPSGVYLNGSFIPTGTSGLSINFEKGQFYFTGKVTGNFSAKYAVKDFNCYFTTKSEEELLFENKVNFRPKYNVTVTGVPENATYGPLIYVKRDSFYNEGFALGGMKNSIAMYRIIALSDNSYDIDALGSLVSESTDSYFLFMSNASPLNRNGGLINSPYNYNQVVNNNMNNNNLIYISEVEYYRFDAKVESSIGEKIYCGYIDVKLELPRYF